MDNTSAGKKENRRQGRLRGRVPSPAKAPSVAEAFAPFLPSRSPELSLAMPEPIDESSRFSLWNLLVAMLWPLTPGIRVTAEEGQVPKMVIDRGQPRDTLQVRREIAKGTRWPAGT